MTALDLDASCPFCCGTIMGLTGLVPTAVECLTCGARGPTSTTRDGALLLWNRHRNIAAQSRFSIADRVDACRMLMALNTFGYLDIADFEAVFLGNDSTKTEVA